jgi:hypothetical protein
MCAVSGEGEKVCERETVSQSEQDGKQAGGNRDNTASQ